MMNWNCEEDNSGTEAKTDYKMMTRELKSIIEDRNEEIDTMREHIKHLKEHIENLNMELKDNFSSEEDYQKLKDENFVLKNELGRIKDAVVNLALGGIQ